MTSDVLFCVAPVALLGSLTLPEPSARSGASLDTWRASGEVPTTAPSPTTSSPPTTAPTPTAAPMPTTAPMVSVTERTLNGTPDVLRTFRLPGPALLIVCAKLETGFDEPRVCCLCVDRTLRGAHAVQVLGRANRAAPNKPPVRVLDFVNSAAEIGAAFRGYVHATTRPLAEHEVIA